MTPKQHKKIWTALENNKEYILYFPAMIAYYIIYPFRVWIEDYRAWMNERDKKKIPSFYNWCDAYNENSSGLSAVVCGGVAISFIILGMVWATICTAMLLIIYFILYLSS